MRGSAVVYAGVIVAAIGLALLVRPARREGANRKRAAVVVGAGLFLAAVGVALPAPETRIVRAASRLDEFAPAWQFRERHTIHVEATPERVFDAIRRVRADEIFLFRTLTWIRRGGRPQRRSILDAGRRESLIDVATHSTFALLADDPPRELVVGTVIAAPGGTRGKPSPEIFRSASTIGPGFTLAAMNFLVRSDAAGGSVLTTETRVFASSPAGRRKFAAYWRVIYPGSAFIRRMWLRAIGKRASEGVPPPAPA